MSDTDSIEEGLKISYEAEIIMHRASFNEEMVKNNKSLLER